jgi:DNA-binding response OmpR family regulator
MSKEILIIEDETDIADLMAYTLAKDGYHVLKSRNGTEGLHIARKKVPDLIILDLMIPGLDGLEVCKQIRSDRDLKEVPIIMVTAKAEEIDRVVGLELGADDYITKPFSPKELAARVKVLFRRIGREAPRESRFTYGPLLLDVTRHEVTVQGREVRLTAKEFGLLKRLLENQGRVLTREVLLDAVWGYDADVTTRTVDVHVRRLREKIPLLSQAIVTVKSLGYKLKEESS